MFELIIGGFMISVLVALYSHYQMLKHMANAMIAMDKRIATQDQIILFQRNRLEALWDKWAKRYADHQL